MLDVFVRGIPICEVKQRSFEVVQTLKSLITICTVAKLEQQYDAHILNILVILIRYRNRIGSSNIGISIGIDQSDLVQLC